MLKEEKFDINKHIYVVGGFHNSEQIMEDYIKSDAFREEIYNDVDIYLVFENEIFVGYYGIKDKVICVDDRNGRKTEIKCIELECIAVDINHVRQGIGIEVFYRFILPKCVERNEEIEYRLLVLFTLNKESTEFYNSINFKKVVEEENYKKFIILPDNFTTGLEPMVYKLPTKKEFEQFYNKNLIL